MPHPLLDRRVAILDENGDPINVGNRFPVDVGATITGAFTIVDPITVEQAAHDDFNSNANLQIADTDVSEINPVPIGIASEPVEILALAGRTGNTTTATQTNTAAEGVLLVLSVTAITNPSSAVGLDVQIQVRDVGDSAVWWQFNGTIDVVRTVQQHGFMVAPGSECPPPNAGSRMIQATSLKLPKYWRVRIVHKDAETYTYRLGYYYLR